MFTTYILFSEKLNKHYTGSAQDFNIRIKKHNSGQVKFTSRGIPWVLVHREEYKTRNEAYKREGEIKSWKGGIKFKKLIKKD